MYLLQWSTGQVCEGCGERTLGSRGFLTRDGCGMEKGVVDGLCFECGGDDFREVLPFRRWSIDFALRKSYHNQLLTDELWSNEMMTLYSRIDCEWMDNQ